MLASPPYRGRGLRQLFEASRHTPAGRFELGIAFSATDSEVSLRVHLRALGLVAVGEVVAEGRACATLAFLVPR